MKTYDKKFLGAKMEEIVLDCDVVYSGDARVIFTLQGISAEIKDIKFRGVARIHLKPLLNGFPFVGGFLFVAGHTTFFNFVHCAFGTPQF